MSESHSPDTGTRRATRSGVRNPRRRPRQSDGDSIKTAPRRKRSKIDADTFAPPRHDGQVNGFIEPASANGDVVPTTRSGRARSQRDTHTPDLAEMPLRNKKASLRRPTRADGATVLMQNDRYSIKLLQSTPKELRREGVEFRGFLGSAQHALATTREFAYIWDYTSSAPLANTRAFKLPFPVGSSDPLPLGALVVAGSTTDVGFVLISSTTGRVVFYESVERAASLGLFHERNVGVQGNTPALWTGETFCDLILAEQAGYILTTTAGRLLHLTLRDAQGRARISAEFLRVEQDASGGLFGSIKGYLGSGAFRRDVAAVHTRALDNRGKIQVIALTERAEFQTWDVEWSGRPTSSNALDFKDFLVAELKKEETAETQGRADQLTTLDFVILNKSDETEETLTPALEKGVDIMILAQVGTADNCASILAEISFAGHVPTCTRLMELESYHPQSARHSRGMPRLLMPPGQSTVIICHADAITVVSLGADDTDSPDAQLRGAQSETSTFEDTSFLRTDQDVAIMGASAEGQRSHLTPTSAIAFVKGAGLVRVSAPDADVTAQPSSIPAKTKIEQAIFHGVLQEDNLLDFARHDSRYSNREMEEAALAISSELLRSTSPIIPTPPTSMEAHLAFKAAAQRALVTHVRQNYPTASKGVLWRLLWDAEKVAAAQQIWSVFEEKAAATAAASAKKRRAATIIDEVCALLRQQDTGSSESSGAIPSTTEVARQFFIHSLHRIDRLFLMAKHVLESMKPDNDHLSEDRDSPDQRSETKMRIVEESCDLWVEGLETVFRFRSDNAETWGILPGFIDDGVLTDAAEYADLPEFWTSTEGMLKAVARMTNSSRELAADIFETEQDDEVLARLEPIIRRCGSENPRLVQLTCLVYQERINWLASRPSQRDREMARRLQENYEKTRHDQIRALATIAQSDAGIKIAVKYRDMDTLTEMIVAEMQYAREELATADVQRRQGIFSYMEVTRLRVESYFERFGDDWANAYFDVVFSHGAGLVMRDGQQPWQAALTKYLRAEPTRAKTCWINDLIVDEDFSRAGRALAVVGKELETRVWNRKVELSMSKLAILATQEELEHQGKGMSAIEVEALMPEQDLTIVRVQQQLANHLYSELFNTLDGQAEIQEAIKRFGLKNQDLHSLQQLLYAGLSRVLANDSLSAAELIDVFTLMDVDMANDREANLKGAEFFLALKVLNAVAPSMPPSRVETLLALIWKRCYVYDDWFEIDSAAARGEAASDEEVMSQLRQTIPWHTLYFALDQGLLDEGESETAGSQVRVIAPSACLGAACAPADLAWRFSRNPDLLDPILLDNRVHDEQLQGLVDDRRLDQWFQMLLVDVTEAVQQERSARADDERRLRDLDAAAEMAEMDGDDDEHTDAPNGFTHAQHPNGVKIRAGFDDADVDGDGDDEEQDGDWAAAGQQEDVDMDVSMAE